MSRGSDDGGMTDDVIENGPAPPAPEPTKEEKAMALKQKLFDSELDMARAHIQRAEAYAEEMGKPGMFDSFEWQRKPMPKKRGRGAKKEPVDPSHPKPKRAPSGYQLFMETITDDMVDGTKGKARMTKVGELWSGLDADKKAEWNAKAKPGQEAGKKALEEWKKEDALRKAGGQPPAALEEGPAPAPLASVKKKRKKSEGEEQSEKKKKKKKKKSMKGDREPGQSQEY